MVSGRFSHERMNAVEALRGPDHMASRNGGDAAAVTGPGDGT
jgi:hypothetical protein